MNFISWIKSVFKQSILIINLPDGHTRRIALHPGILSFGRADTNDLAIKHESVSRQHGQLKFQANTLLVEDLESVNGTWVADRPIPPHAPVEVGLGQSFWVGKVEVHYQQKDFSVPILTVASAMIIILLVIFIIPKPTHSKANPFVCNSPSLLIVQPDPNQRPVIPTPKARPTDTAVAESPTENPLEGTQTAAVNVTPTNPETGNGGVYNDLSFLDLPFPYSDDRTECSFGTLEEFQQASQRNDGRGGRINSFFDHFYPKYPYDPEHPERSANGGREGPNPPEAKNVLLFTGELSPYDSYSGHPAYDFSTDGYGNLNTPVCAAADGIVDKVGGTEAEGLYVKINHAVDFDGEEILFQTFYLHLKDDEFFEAMKDKVGQPILIHSRIGTMGNTGHSTGPHLHFEIRRDVNNDGIFSQSEVVDPYGYIPSEEYVTDKWTLPDDYLWIYPLRVEQTIPISGNKNTGNNSGRGGLFSDALNRPAQLCAPANTLPPGGTLSFSVSLSPPPAQGLVSIGRAAVISVKSVDGQYVNNFQPPIRIMIPFLERDLDFVKNNDALRIYRLESHLQGDKVISAWRPLDRNIDTENGIAVAYTDTPGQFAILGEPTKDTFPPRLEISVSGPQTKDGSFYDTVSVTLMATDDQNGISKISWSLDGRQWSNVTPPENKTWQTYTTTFTVEPNGIPEPQPETEGDVFIGGLGRFQIIAYAIDTLGNSGETQPAIERFVIDPSKKPSAALKNRQEKGFRLFSPWLIPVINLNMGFYQ